MKKVYFVFSNNDIHEVPILYMNLTLTRYFFLSHFILIDFLIHIATISMDLYFFVF